MKMRLYAAAATLLALVIAGARPTTADEGMWTFDNPPLKLLKDKYNFTPATQWLDHIRLSSVRFNDGGSGKVVREFGQQFHSSHPTRQNGRDVSQGTMHIRLAGSANQFTSVVSEESMECSFVF